MTKSILITFPDDDTMKAFIESVKEQADSESVSIVIEDGKPIKIPVDKIIHIEK
jgi:hypothetical protein